MWPFVWRDSAWSRVICFLGGGLPGRTAASPSYSRSHLLLAPAKVTSPGLCHTRLTVSSLLSATYTPVVLDPDQRILKDYSGSRLCSGESGHSVRFPLVTGGLTVLYPRGHDLHLDTDRTMLRIFDILRANDSTLRLETRRSYLN